MTPQSLEDKLKAFKDGGIHFSSGFSVEALLEKRPREDFEAPGFKLPLVALAETDPVSGKNFSPNLWYFNAEGIEKYGDYSAIVRRMCEISQGALSLTDIDDSVDLESKKASVSFRHHNELISVPCLVDGHWADPDVFRKLNELLAKVDRFKTFIVYDLNDGHNCIIGCVLKEELGRINVKGIPFTTLKSIPQNLLADPFAKASDTNPVGRTYQSAETSDPPESPSESKTRPPAKTVVIRAHMLPVMPVVVAILGYSIYLYMNDDPSLLTAAFICLSSIALAFVFYYNYIWATVKLLDDRLMMPVTSDQGLPVFLVGKKVEIPIRIITKISRPLGGEEAKLAIISPSVVPTIMDYRFLSTRLYGQETLERLARAIRERHRSIDFKDVFHEEF